MEHLLIVWHESGDEIHFHILDMVHFDRIDNSLENPSKLNHSELEEFIKFIHENTLEKFFIQTYCNEPFFTKTYNIKKVMYIPELGM